MANFDAKNIRNIVLLGHQSSGKTTLTESFAFVTKTIGTKGEVEKKNTLSDYTPDEQKRGASIQTAIIPVVSGNTKINIFDVPGNDDFVSETIGSLVAVDGAILLVDAQVGVQVGTVKGWNALKKAGVPTIIFLNKVDKENVKIDEVIADIQTKLTKAATPFALMDGDKVVDIVNDKAAGGAYRDALLEEVAKTDDALLEKFFGGEEFTDEEIHSGLRKAVASDELVPILCGCATKNIGVQELLDNIVHYLPSPADVKPQEATDEAGKPAVRNMNDNEPFSGYVFKTIVDPFTGVTNYIKVNSGVLHAGDDVSINGVSQRISMLFSVSGKTLANASEIHSGDVCAVTRLDKVATGDTLSFPKAAVKFVPASFPNAVIFKAIELKNKNDESKVGSALSKMQLEDPCIEVKRNNETKQLLLGGVSNSHIDFVIEKLKNTYKIEVNTSAQKVVYRESIKKIAEGDGRYVKQSGGSGFYGVVKMRFEPCDESAFAEEVFGGAVPKNYFPAVEKGFFEALVAGPLAGFPVIGVKGILIDGKYHPVDSNEQAFKMAGILAFKDAYPKCSPIILEPIMKVVVSAPAQYTGDVMSDLNTRRARIQNMEEHEGVQMIEALVPEAEIVDYATQLKSITQASGSFTREFVNYEEVPEYLKDKVIKENKVAE